MTTTPTCFFGKLQATNFSLFVGGYIFGGGLCTRKPRLKMDPFLEKKDGLKEWKRKQPQKTSRKLQKYTGKQPAFSNIIGTNGKGISPPRIFIRRWWTPPRSCSASSRREGAWSCAPRCPCPPQADSESGLGRGLVNVWVCSFSFSGNPPRPPPQEKKSGRPVGLP